MVSFAVGEKKNRWIEERMRDLGIREEDLEETFVRSLGAGGQKVNKTSSCVSQTFSGLGRRKMHERQEPVHQPVPRPP